MSNLIHDQWALSDSNIVESRSTVAMALRYFVANSHLTRATQVCPLSDLKLFVTKPQIVQSEASSKGIELTASVKFHSKDSNLIGWNLYPGDSIGILVEPDYMVVHLSMLADHEEREKGIVTFSGHRFESHYPENNDLASLRKSLEQCN